MRRVLLLISCLLLFAACTQKKKHIVFESLDLSSENVKIFLLPLGNKHDSTRYESLKNPVVIENREIIREIKKGWVFSEAKPKKGMIVTHKMLIKDGNKDLFAVWFDRDLEILIWNEELLIFEKDKLIKYRDSFRTLTEKRMRFSDISTARDFVNSVRENGGIVKNIKPKLGYWEKYEGVYSLKRSRGELKPIRNVGKVRAEIKKDFKNKEFYLIDYTFEEDSDSLLITIASNSAYCDYFPKGYRLVKEFEPVTEIVVDCIILEEDGEK